MAVELLTRVDDFIDGGINSNSLTEKDGTTFWDGHLMAPSSKAAVDNGMKQSKTESCSNHTVSHIHTLRRVPCW